MKKHACQADEDQWYRNFKGKIILSWSFYEDYVKKIESYGASGLIHIWSTGEKVIHEETVGSVWGTPTLEKYAFLPKIPVVGIKHQDGIKLIEEVSCRDVKAVIFNNVNNHVGKAYLPVACIPWSSSEYVLLSGHYDSWYEGVTDNAVDHALLARDTKLTAAFVYSIADSEILPVDFSHYFTRAIDILRDIDKHSDDEFELGLVLEMLEKLMRKTVLAFEGCKGNEAAANRLIRRIGGEMNRLMYSYSDRYDFDNTFAVKPFPGLQKVYGIYRNKPE